MEYIKTTVLFDNEKSSKVGREGMGMSINVGGWKFQQREEVWGGGCREAKSKHWL
jgi:hypothetical protein